MSRLRRSRGVSWNGTRITETISDGWRPLAAETLNGANRILWKRLADNPLTYWEMNANWSNLTGNGSYGRSNTPDALAPETLFGIDLNGDGAIG